MTKTQTFRGSQYHPASPEHLAHQLDRHYRRTILAAAGLLTFVFSLLTYAGF